MTHSSCANIEVEVHNFFSTQRVNNMYKCQKINSSFDVLEKVIRSQPQFPICKMEMLIIHFAGF